MADLEQSRFHADLLRAGLQDRVVVAPAAPGSNSWQLLYLQSGTVSVLDRTQSGSPDNQSFDGPLLLSQPVADERSLRLIAGSVGAHVVADDIGLSSYASTLLVGR